MTMYTFPQKKLARVELDISTRAKQLERLDDQIAKLQAKIDKLKLERRKVEFKACKMSRVREVLQKRFSKSKGSNIDQPLTAKLVFYHGFTGDRLGVEYTKV